MTYIATFYSHFGAMRYDILCRDAGIESRTMPVPRDLSSSCGTCVRCEDRWLKPASEAADELERIVQYSDGQYIAVYTPDMEN